MINRDGSIDFDVACDSCPEIEVFELGDDWSGLLQEITAAGWTYRKMRGEWKHYCPACTEGEG